MPRGKDGGSSAGTTNDLAGPSGADWEPPPEVVRALEPWIDLRAVGPDGFFRWLRAILPALPAPPADPSPPKDLDARVAQLALALVDSAAAGAAAHFQASEYFRENLLLARRVFALEAMLRTARASVPEDPTGADRVAGRYLPGGSDA